MKTTVKQLADGQWAVFVGGKYYPSSVSLTKREAEIKRLYRIAQDAQAIIDDVDNQLRALGALNESDPHDYMA